jgi:VCBS repeat protein
VSQVQAVRGLDGLAFGGAVGSFNPFGTTDKGGVFVAVADVNGDHVADIIVSRASGAPPEVKVFSGSDGSQLADFQAFDPAFKGGVTVAAADFDQDGMAEIVTAVAKGVPEVRVYDGTGNLSGAVGDNDFPVSFGVTKFTQGATVALGDVTGDGVPDFLLGAGKGAIPAVAIYDGATGAAVRVCHPFDAKLKRGVRVAVADIDEDGRYEVLATLGSGALDSAVAFDASTCQSQRTYPSFGLRKGVFVGGVRR